MVRRLLFPVLLVLSSCSTRIRPFQHKSIQPVYTIAVKQFVNVFVVKTGDKWLMIDAGLPGTETLLERKLGLVGLKPTDLAGIVVTHGHFDHAGTAAYFQQRYQIPIIASAPDAPLLAMGQQRYICPTNAMARLIKKTKIKDQTFTTFKPDVIVTGDTTLQSMGIDARVYLTGGHTPGMLVVQIGTYLFCSDLIRGKPLARHRPALHYFQCDLADNQAAIRKALTLDTEQWFTGHFGAIPTKRAKAWLDTQPRYDNR